MINKLYKIIKRVNDALGVSVKLLKPNKKILAATAAINIAAGAGIAFAGILFKNKWCAFIGGLGIISGIVQRYESKKII